MCGISVVVCNQEHSVASLSELEQSLELIRHRGPDDSGIYISPDNQVGEQNNRFLRA